MTEMIESPLTAINISCTVCKNLSAELCPQWRCAKCIALMSPSKSCVGVENCRQSVKDDILTKCGRFTKKDWD